MTTKRTALITGANRGLGLEIARQLGNLDHKVWLGCRDADLGGEAAATLKAEGIDAHAIQLDINDDVSVQTAVARIEAEDSSLDVLVNNAGLMGDLMSPPSEEKPDDVMRAMFDTNVFGTIRVTQGFVPLLLKSQGARIVMMSSGLGSISMTTDMTKPIWGMNGVGYSASKAALNMFTVKLAKELLLTGIKVNAACPGSVATNVKLPGLREVEQGAQIAVRLATLGWQGPTGGFFHDGEGPGIQPYTW